MPSRIEWTTDVWNAVTGCEKISAGCKFCYAKHGMWHRLSAMTNTVYHGRQFENVQCHPERLIQPLRWTRPRRIFTNSMSDLFHPKVPFEFIGAMFGAMALAPQHTFQILTKRPERMLQFFEWVEYEGRCGPDRSAAKLCEALLLKQCEDKSTVPPKGFKQSSEAILERGWPLPNVWIGVSVENQEAANERIPLLVKAPAAVRWVSAEPLLGPVDLNDTPAGDVLCHCDGCMSLTPDTRIDWVVVGGESGYGARPMHPSWATALRDQCLANGVRYFFKQWGEWAPCAEGEWHGLGPVGKPKQLVVSLNAETAGGFLSQDFACQREAEGWVPMIRIGKGTAGRLLDGVLHDDYPG